MFNGRKNVEQNPSCQHHMCNEALYYSLSLTRVTCHYYITKTFEPVFCFILNSFDLSNCCLKS